MFSLVQQVISHIPEALYNKRTPVVFFRDQCCYWIASGYQNRNTVWEYYFEPLVDKMAVENIPQDIRNYIESHSPNYTKSGYFINEDVFVSNHFGNHTRLPNSLKIPFKWDDPDNEIRKKAAQIIAQYIKPRKFIAEKVEQFFDENMKDTYVVGVHIRGTDVTDVNQHNIHRRGAFNLAAYENVLREQLKEQPYAKIFVATDSYDALSFIENLFPKRVMYHSSIFHMEGEVSGKGPSGWGIPAYISESPDKAAQNGEEAIVDYLLLSKCQFLIHNGSGLARTVLLRNPSLKHFNVHSKKKYVDAMLKDTKEVKSFLKMALINNFRKLKNKINSLR